MALPTLFISHEHGDAKLAGVVERLFTDLFDGTHKVSVLRSSSTHPGVGPGAGEHWREWIDKAADADECVFVLRRAPSNWVLWEMGAVAANSVRRGRPSRGIPLLVGLAAGALPPQIDLARAVDGATREGINGLLRTLIARLGLFREYKEEYVDSLITAHVDTYLAALAQLPDVLTGGFDAAVQLDQARDELLQASRHPNLLFRHIVFLFSQSVARIGRDAREASQLKVPAVRYPQYLLELQGNRERIVNAIAIVDDVEHFWRDRVGVRIASAANESSRRIFVFGSAATLKNYWDVLVRHAARYKIRALNYDVLTRTFPGYESDFSIILERSGDHAGVVAFYSEQNADAGDAREIVFDASRDTVRERLGIFEEIWKISREVDKDADADGLAEEVFGPVRPRLRPLPRRTTEMSEYIDIEAYDHHEEEHAYYRDMMRQMERILVDAAESMSLQKARVLELGAGTGIFTSRLLRLALIDQLHAVELDWACNRRLHAKFRSSAQSRLTIHFEDSRTYNPEGSFDFVVTSFADHHISLDDKTEYLLNVRNNLRRDGLFIVGDEFLREPRLGSAPEDRVDALTAYHGHIIDIARREGHPELAALEESALKSGLEQKGDFKIPRSVYRGAVRAAGFEIVQEICVGPAVGQDEIGGIFIFVMRHALAGDDRNRRQPRPA